MSAGRAPYLVVHVVSALNIGGLERVVYDLVRGRARDRFECRVICLDEVGVWGNRFAELDCTVECVEGAGRGWISGILRLAKRLAELAPDIVHTHNVKCHVRGALAARLAGVPVVINTKHGRNHPVRPMARLANRLACAVSTSLVAVSEDCADIWRRIEHANPAKVIVILNGVDLAAFDHVNSLDIDRRDPQETGPRAVMVARLNQVKDPETLVRAVRLVRDGEPDFCLDLVGDGPLRADVERLVQDLGLAGAARVDGARHDVKEILRNATLFVLSSTSEGIALTLLEAMAAGLPVVATRVGGNAEVVADGETGLLVPARSPEALADAMLTLLSDRRKCREMGRAGRERVAALFDVRRTVASYERLYLEALNSDARSRARTVPVAPAA